MNGAIAVLPWPGSDQAAALQRQSEHGNRLAGAVGGLRHAVVSGAPTLTQRHGPARVR
jgi:hypothetical protein